MKLFCLCRALNMHQLIAEANPLSARTLASKIVVLNFLVNLLRIDFTSQQLQA